MKTRRCASSACSPCLQFRLQSCDGVDWLCWTAVEREGWGSFRRRHGNAATLGRLQVVAFHQTAGLQRTGVREERRLYVQAFFCQGGVAAGGGTHLPRFGEVRLLPLS